jgi:hypothetical protein
MPQIAGGVPVERGHGSASASSARRMPSIEFLRPLPNELFFDFPIYIQVRVSNFNLVPPGSRPAANQAVSSGHIAYSMDDFPTLATDEPQVMFGKNLGFGYIPVGRHLLTAQLVDDNDKPLNPPVTIKQYVWSGHPAPKEMGQDDSQNVKGDLTSAELKQLHHHLDEIAKELKRIQSGSPGYQPDPLYKNDGRTSE